jgi:hypothetical protein
MAKYTIVKEYEVEGPVSLDEANSAVENFNQSFGRDNTADDGGVSINIYRTIPEPEEWDKDEQGDWYKSDEYKARMVYAKVTLTNKYTRSV